MEENYNISFFKPTTELARKNARFSIILISIWAIAVFGFQILLKIIEKPTPEQAYLTYEKVLNNVKGNQATNAENIDFVKSALSVIGKLSIKKEDKEILNQAVSSIVFKIVSEEQKIQLTEKIKAFQLVKQNDILDPVYLNNRNQFSAIGSSIIKVEPYSIEAKLLPFVISEYENYTINYDEVQRVMSKYLIHNQSFLTNSKFLGFPFHYFYTAVFLLVLFIGLCLIFCIKTDKIYKELNIEERI